MGVLGASESMNGRSGGGSPSASVEPSTPEAPEHDGGAEPEAPAEPAKARDDGFVPYSAIEPPKKSRREAAAEKQIQEHLGRFQNELGGKLTAFEQRIAENQQTIIRLQQELAESRRQPPPQQYQPPPQQQNEEPEQIQREARRALAENRFDDYEALNAKALELRMERRFQQRLEQEIGKVRENIPQPLDPMLQVMLAKHENVAVAGRRGVQAVMLKEQELDLYGMPPGPERTRKAFELADKMLGGQRQTSSYDPAAASALSGATPTRAAASSSPAEEGYKLSALEQEVARGAGMTPEQYVKWKFPERWRK